MKSNANVPMVIPPTTPVPNERLPLAPTPLDIINGNRPKIIVNAVIRIGRRRALAALTAEAISPIPALRRSAAYSVSTVTGYHVHELKKLIASQAPEEDQDKYLVRDLLNPNDFVVLVVPIDSAAPKGRLILPQQQTIRDVLEAGAISIVTRDTELKETLSSLGKKPRLVITDSQAFAKVSADTPEDIPLTSFSILLSRYKGNLKLQVEGAQMLDKLEDGDKILVCEGCTHHRQCDDIGTVKLPRWIRQHTGNKDLHFEFTSGTEFPVDLSPYKLIIHCGGCTLNEREMQYRLKCAEDQGVPITNYGTAIAHLKGVLERSLIPVRESLE